MPSPSRPLPVTIGCAILLAAGLFNIIYTFTGAYAPYGLLYSAFHTLLTVIVFAAISGIWGMEKWGLYLFTGLLLAKFGLDLYTGAFTYWELLLLLPLLAFWRYVGRMR